MGSGKILMMFSSALNPALRLARQRAAPHATSMRLLHDLAAATLITQGP